jgi:hypothetical protein
MFKLLEFDHTPFRVTGEKVVYSVFVAVGRFIDSNFLVPGICLINFVLMVKEKRDNAAGIGLIALTEAEKEIPVAHYDAVFLLEPHLAADFILIELSQTSQLTALKENDPTHINLFERPDDFRYLMITG